MAKKKELQNWDNPRDFLNMDRNLVLAQVVQDFNDSNNYQQNAFKLFQDCYKMYRAYTDEEDMREDGSNLFIPYVFNIVENAFPKIVKSLFSVRPYIPFMPVNANDKDSTQKAENMTKLVEWELDNKMKGRLVYNDILRSACMYGTAISKQTWKLEERPVVKRAEIAGYQTDPETGLTVSVTSMQPMETTEITYDAPFMQNIELQDFFFDPYGTDIDNCEYVIHRYWLPMHKIIQMAENKQLDVDAETIKKSLTPKGRTATQGREYDKSTAINMGQKPNRSNEVEVLEYWTNDLKCIVLNKTLVALVTPNPYWHRRKPFSKWECVPVSGEFYGIGIIEMCRQLQVELNTTRNQRIDNVSFALNRMYTILRTANIDTTQLRSRPNGFIEVDDHDDIKELPINEVKSSSYTEETVIKNDMDVTSGVYNYTRGEPADRRETATTASILAQAGNDRFESQVLQIGWGGFSDSALQLAWLNRQYITVDTEIAVVGDDGKQSTIMVNQDNIDVDLQIIPAPSSLFSAANKQIQQNALVQLSNIMVNNPNVNQQEFLRRVFEAFDFTDPEALIANPNPAPEQAPEQTQSPSDATTQEDILNAANATGSEEGEEGTNLTNADTGGQEMTENDTAFLQNVGINA